jgi:dynein light intermediate chain 2
VTPLPAPLLIVGAKHDRLRALPAATQAVVAKALRALAHMHGAALLCCSEGDEAAMARARTALTTMAFRGAPAVGRAAAVDPAHALVVPAGADSLAAIGLPPAAAAGTAPLDAWRAALAAVAGPAPTAAEPASAAADPSLAAKYAEPVLDALREQKAEELERYRRRAERKAASERLALAADAAAATDAAAAGSAASATRRTKGAGESSCGGSLWFLYIEPP